MGQLWSGCCGGMLWRGATYDYDYECGLDYDYGDDQASDFDFGLGYDSG